MYFLFSGRLLGRNTTSFSYLGAPATRTFSLDMAVVYLFRWKLALGLCLVKLLHHLRQHGLDPGI